MNRLIKEPMVITSRNNARLARARKVRDGKEADEIFVEGRRVVDEVIRSSAKLVECIIADGLAETEFGKQMSFRLDRNNVPVLRVSDSLFKSVSDTVHSQGIALIAKRPVTGREVIERSLSAERPTTIVCLFEINDPSNLGSVFRTAEAAGVTGVVLSKGSADAFSAKAVRAGMGSSVRVPVWDQADLIDAIRWARDRRIQVIAADVDAEHSYTQIDWRRPSMIVFGSEAHGLGKIFVEMADETVTIPMRNGVESLNLAVSSGIILFESVRQRTA
jgi:TrmH family RNA methyltransferase